MHDALLSDAVSVESNVEEQTQTHPQLETSNFGTGMSHTSNADFKTQIESNEKIRLSPNLENSSQMRLSPPKTPYEENGKTSEHLQPQLEEARRLAKKLLASTTTDVALKLSSGLNDSKEINKVVTDMTQEETAIKDAKSTNGVPSTVEKKDFLKSDSEDSPSLATNNFELIVANESAEDHMTTEEEHLTNIKYNPLQLSMELKEIGNDSQVIESTITDTNVLTAEPQGTLNFRMTDEASKDETVLTKVDLDVTQKTSYDPLKLHLEINETKEEPANDVPKDATNLDTQDDLTKITTNPDAGTLTQFDVSKLHSEVANAAEISTSPVPEEEIKTVHVEEEQLTNIKYNPLQLSVELEEVGKDSQTTFDTLSSKPESELIVDFDTQEELAKNTYDPLQLSLELKKAEDDSSIPIGILSPADFNVTVADPDAGTVTQFDVSKLHSEVANAAEISTSPISEEESKTEHVEEKQLTNIKYNPLQLSAELEEVGKDSQTTFDTLSSKPESELIVDFDTQEELAKNTYDPLQLSLELKKAEDDSTIPIGILSPAELNVTVADPDAGTVTQFDVSKLHSEVANAAEISASPVPEEESKTVHVEEEQLTNIKYNPLQLSVELEEVGKDSQTTFDTLSSKPESELIVDFDTQEELAKNTYDPLQLSLELKKAEDDSTIPIGILSPTDFNVTVADPDAGTVTQFDVSTLHSEVANAAEISTSPVPEEERKTVHVEEEQLTNIKYNPLQLSVELEEVGKDSQTTFDTLSSKPESELIVDFDTQEELTKNTYDPLQLSLELKKAEDDSSIPIGILSPAELKGTVADPDAGTVTQFDVSKLRSEVANAAEISTSPVPEEESKTVHVEEEQLTNIKYNPLQLSVELEEVGKDSQTTFDTSSPVPDSELIVDLDKQEDLTKITYDPLQLSLELKKTEDDSTIPIDAGTVTQFDVSKLHSEVANAAEISDSPVPEEESKTVHVEEEQLTNIKYNPLQLSVELEEVGKDSQTTFDTSSPIPDSELIVTEPEFINIKYNPLELNMELQKVQEIAKTELEPNQLSEVVQMVHENPDSINYEQKNDVTNGDKQENLSRNMYNPLQLNMELKEVEKDSTAEFGLLSPNNSNTVKTDLDENVTTQFDSSNLHSEVTKAAEGPSHFIPSEEHKVAHIDEENLTNVKYNPLELSAELKEAGKNFLIELDEASPKHKLIEEEISNNMVIENEVNVKYDPSKLSTELKEAEKSSETLFDTSSNKHPNINEDDKNLNSTVSYDTEKLHLEISEAVQAPKIFNTSEKDVESDSAQVFSISTEPDSIVVEEKMSKIDFDSSKLRAELEAATNSLQLTEILPEVEVTKEIATSFDVATLRLEVKDAETHKENSLEIISDDKKWNDVDEPKTSFDILKLRSELSDDSVEDDAIKLNTFQDESHQEHNKGDATENTESKSVDLFQLHQEIEQANNGLISENNESEVINGSKLLTEDNELNGNKSNVDQTAVETTESLITPSINESDAPNYITNINKQITKPTHIHETKLDQSNLNMKINDPKESKHLNLDDERERPLSKNSTASTDSTSTIIFNADAAVDPSYADLDNISPKFSRKRNASLTEKSLALVLDQQLVLAAPSVLKKETVETESPEYIYIPLKDASHDEISSSESKHSSQEVEHDKLQLEEEFVMIDEPIISPRTISKNESAVEKVLGSVTDQQLAIAVPNLKIERKEASDELAEPNYIYIPLKNPDTEHADSEENDDTENLTISSIGHTFDISKLRTEVEEATKYSNRDEDPASRAHSGNSKGKANNGLKNNQLYTYEYQHTVHTDDKSNQVMDVATIIETTQISDDGVPLAVQLNQGQGQVFIIINGGVDVNQRRNVRRKSSGKLRGSEKSKAPQAAKNNGSDLEEKSATKIQAGVRGFLVRRRQKKTKVPSSDESAQA
ncbi:hypothetical protein FQR65_LT06345 [Abscondita terminalis]|nr:hypothetical protein FQR65_LT06345 [Abscondita terminalis]